MAIKHRLFGPNLKALVLLYSCNQHVGVLDADFGKGIAANILLRSGITQFLILVTERMNWEHSTGYSAEIASLSN